MLGKTCIPTVEKRLQNVPVFAIFNKNKTEQNPVYYIVINCNIKRKKCDKMIFNCISYIDCFQRIGSWS